MDQPGLPAEALCRNLNELERVNRFLGGYATLFSGLDYLKRHGWFAQDRPLRLLDLGSGAGDNLRMAHQWCQRQGVAVSLTGLDWSSAMLDEAQSRCRNEAFEWVQADALTYDFSGYDWVMGSLFCHHLDDAQLLQLVRRVRQAGAGLLINDLHRHPLAWAGIWTLTRILPASYLVRHDGPLSVRRSFCRADWQRLLQNAGIEQAHVQWRWAFRWLVVMAPPGPPAT